MIYINVARHLPVLSSRIATTVVYTPRTAPGHPSMSRQVAYNEQKPLIGPSGDPEGWYTLPKVTVKNTVNGVPVEVDYTVSTTLA